MANITLIDPTQSISLAPNIINANFTNLNQELTQVRNLLSVSNNSLELHGKTTAPVNGIEAAIYVATAQSGLLFNGLTDGVNQVFTVNTDGIITGLKIELDAAETSLLGVIQVAGTSLFTGEATFNGAIKSNGAKIMPHNLLEIVPSNVGSSATAPLNLGDKEEVMIDFSNGGSQFVASGSDALLKIDIASLVANQKLKIRLQKKNSVNALKLWNGTTGSPLFANIDYTTGYVDIADTTYPEFDDGAAGTAWLELQYIEVTAGVFRLVVLDSQNVLNV